jgi:hypothetical protein
MPEWREEAVHASQGIKLQAPRDKGISPREFGCYYNPWSPGHDGLSIFSQVVRTRYAAYAG